VPKSAVQKTKNQTSDSEQKTIFLSGVMQRLLKRAPEAKTFATQLFARSSYEDLSVYRPEDLALYTENAYMHLQKRAPGTLSVRVESEPENHITIVQILNDNMPFLLDSVMGALNDQNCDIRLVTHPIFTVSRDKSGKLTGLYGEQPPPFGMTVLRESFIYIYVDILDSASAEKLKNELEKTLADVRLVVTDWRPMLARFDAAIAQFKDTPPPIPVAELAEAVQFLEWLRHNNFTFLGLREYKVEGTGAKLRLDPENKTGLGLLRDSSAGILRRGSKPVTMTAELRHFLHQTNPLIITKANLRSRVHRRVQVDYVGIKLFDGMGTLVGELRLAGLFTSTAYTYSARAIPYLRRKIETVLQRAGFDADSHSGKSLVNIIEQYPRDELFQIDDDELLDFAERLLQLEERPRVRVLSRQDKFDRFVSILVFIPRERYNAGTRGRIGEMLAKAYEGRVANWNASYPEGPLARLHFIIAKSDKSVSNPSQSKLEHDVAQTVRTWEDEFSSEISKAFKNGESKKLRNRYRYAFPPAYQDNYSPQTAARDIRVLERLNPQHPLAIDFYRFEDAQPNELGLKVYNRGSPLSLSKRVPVLEAMGFSVISETSVEVMPGDSEEDLVVLHDLRLSTLSGKAYDFEAADARIEEAFLAIWQGRAENDGYNALVLSAELQWREVACLRGMSRYLRQVRIPYSQDYMWGTLGKNPQIAADLFAFFQTRFDPSLKLSGQAREARQAEISEKIEKALQNVTSLDEDRILRRFLNLAACMLRTNFYQRDKNGDTRATITFKLDTKKLEGLPDPRPMFEIFVYSPRVEGIHLRFGKIARGGIRWSDRPQDYRTEVLGLVKAQQIKNAVIVPVGAKGGFVPKHLPEGPREAIQDEGIAAYKLFVSSLLDITDTISPQGSVIHPDGILRYDDDDPYLVVAADKGTATFSDIANELSISSGYWLNDAFASGGSAGYDHKKMGITARGAWEAVKRHFREMDVNIQSTPFSVVGIGDMSGDVFGNGILLSKHIKLIGAFDHRDIFIDPDPDPALSYKERARLFKLPRSSWQDYDAKLISAGGGVFSRNAKSIPISPQMQALLNIKEKSAAPSVVMQALLRAQVDLLWFGGIGTYVRSSFETDEQVGDRANDAIRVSGNELRAKVIGEGANLGMTQRGRIEAAQQGIRLNTDATDNSAGVNTSDMEVNIKIAFGGASGSEKISLQERNKLLEQMTDDVAHLVLRTNYLQTLSISLSQRRGAEDAGFAEHLMQMLEAEGRLNRKIEYLPLTQELEARQKTGAGLTRPELSVLLAYAKLSLYDRLLISSLPDDPYFSNRLKNYFPEALRKNFPRAIAQHRLRREIIATDLSNDVCNGGGSTILSRAIDQTGAPAHDVAAAYAITQDVFNLIPTSHAIDALDGKINGALQLQLYAEVQDVLLDRTVWFLRHGRLSLGLSSVVKQYQEKISQLETQLLKVLPENEVNRFQERKQNLIEKNIPKPLAERISGLPVLIDATDIVLASLATKSPLLSTAKAFYEAGDLFGLAEIYAEAKKLFTKNYFERLALDRAIADLSVANRRLAIQIVEAGGMEDWKKQKGESWQRARETLRGIASGPDLSVAKLTVAAGQLSDITSS
jgi:glutamate dehydrogenase